MMIFYLKHKMAREKPVATDQNYVPEKGQSADIPVDIGSELPLVPGPQNAIGQLGLRQLGDRQTWTNTCLAVG